MEKENILDINLDDNIINFKCLKTLNEYKIKFIKTTINFIINKVKKIEDRIEKNPNNRDFKKKLNIDYIDKYIASGSYEDFEYLLTLSKLITLNNNLRELEKVNNGDSSKFTLILQNSFNYLVEFGLTGLYWYLNISNENTYLSPGQSLDLYKLIKILNNFWNHNSIDLNSIKKLKELFYNSFNNYIPILISFN